MIKFDFDNKYIDKIKKEEYLNKKESIFEEFSKCDMIGWTKRFDESVLDEIIKLKDEVKKNADCLVVIGIGGSYLGSYAVSSMFNSYFKNEFPIYYAGNTLSSTYMEELIDLLRTKDFYLNVISKSGTTLEIMVTYNLIYNLMKEKYSESELKKRIIMTTDSEKGKLRSEVNTYGYRSFTIPSDIGGRYSIITPAHLFPLSFSLDIKEFVKGYFEGIKYNDEAFLYAVTRKLLYDKKKYVELYSVSEEKELPFTEWLKQLFGESEGKSGLGIFPASILTTRDLHSLGQFIQDGTKILFETFIQVEKKNTLEYEGHNLHEMNNTITDSVRIAHDKGMVPTNKITITSINEKEVGSLIYFFLMSAAYSGLLFGINPFDQKGVEVYKSEVRKNIAI